MSSAPTNVADASDNRRTSDASCPGSDASAGPADGIAGQGCGAGDEAVRQRKRGVELEDAIRSACVAELADIGYGGLTIESVASRAQTGKASIYRRWPSKQDLVMDSVGCLMSGPLMRLIDREYDDQVSTRDALLDLMKQVASIMGGPDGAAMRSLMGESLRDDSFAGTFQCDFFDPRKQALIDLLRRGVTRGEVRPDAVDEVVADMIAGTLIHRVLIRRQRPTAAEIETMLDAFIIRAIRPD